MLAQGVVELFIRRRVGPALETARREDAPFTTAQPDSK
jgi:hypothetical protein